MIPFETEAQKLRKKKKKSEREETQTRIDDALLSAEKLLGQRVQREASQLQQLPQFKPLPAMFPSDVPDGEEEALKWLIQKESSGNVLADNPTSTAFGLGQLIEANRRAYGKKLGFDPDTTDYDEQLAMMKEYIKERYGSALKAKEFWEQHNWY